MFSPQTIDNFCYNLQGTAVHTILIKFLCRLGDIFILLDYITPTEKIGMVKCIIRYHSFLKCMYCNELEKVAS